MRQDELDTLDIIILSGDSLSGTWERYRGERTNHALKLRLTKERANGERWASAWIEAKTVEDKGHPGAKVYLEMDRDLDKTTGRVRAVPEIAIEDTREIDKPLVDRKSVV